MKHMNKTIIALTVTSALIGCSPEEQDIVSEDNQTSVVANGAVIDPLITSAIVFADYDEDGVLDTFEPWAFTDEDGYYSVSRTGENYCTTTPKFCLELPNDDSVKLVAVGGYDLSTLKKVTTRLSRYFTGSGDQFITPLTSVGDLSLDDLEAIDKDVNILIDAFESEDSAFSLAFKVHKIVEIIAEIITEEYPAIGDNEDFPTDVSGYIYDAINKIGNDEGISLTTLLDELTDEQVDDMLDEVREKLDLFVISQSSAQASNTVNSAVSSSVTKKFNATSNEVAQALRELVVAFNNVMEKGVSSSVDSDDDNALAAIRLLEGIRESVTESLANDETVSSTTLNDVVNAVFQDPSLLGSIAEEAFDLGLLDLDSIGDITTSLEAMSARPTLPDNLTGMQFSLSDNDDSREATVGLFFDAAGAIKACVKYNNLRDSEDSQNTQGTLLEGEWDQTQYAIDLSLEIAGSDQSLRIKTQDDNSVIFDYDNEETEWETNLQFTTTEGAIPNTNEACQTWIAELENNSVN